MKRQSKYSVLASLLIGMFGIALSYVLISGWSHDLLFYLCAEETLVQVDAASFELNEVSDGISPGVGAVLTSTLSIRLPGGESRAVVTEVFDKGGRSEVSAHQELLKRLVDKQVTIYFCPTQPGRFEMSSQFPMTGGVLSLMAMCVFVLPPLAFLVHFMRTGSAR